MTNVIAKIRGFAPRLLAVTLTAALVAPMLLALGSTVANAAEISCTPSNVVVYTSRVHIKCLESVGGIYYFAASTADAAHVSRVLSTITTATVAGRTVIIRYDPSDTSGASIGCQVNDCRLLQAVGFWR